MYLLSRFRALAPRPSGSVVVFGLFIATASDLAAANLTGLTLALTLSRLAKELLVCLTFVPRTKRVFPRGCLMIRRDFFRQSLFAAGSAYTVGRAPLAPLQAVAQQVPATDVTRADVTRYVSQFIVETEFEEIPEDAMANGKKHVLDGFGLAVSGWASELGPLMQ